MLSGLRAARISRAIVFFTDCVHFRGNHDFNLTGYVGGLNSTAVWVAWVPSMASNVSAACPNRGVETVPRDFFVVRELLYLSAGHGELSM